MWSRSELKSRAKEILHVNYWKAVLVSLIYTFVSGGGSGGGSSSSASSSSSSGSSSGGNIFSSPEEWKIFIAAMSAVLIIILIALAVGFVLSIFVFSPLQVGCQRYFILCGKQPATLSDVVFAFSNSYMNIVKIMFFKNPANIRIDQYIFYLPYYHTVHLQRFNSQLVLLLNLQHRPVIL